VVDCAMYMPNINDFKNNCRNMDCLNYIPTKVYLNGLDIAGVEYVDGERVLRMTIPSNRNVLKPIFMRTFKENINGLMTLEKLGNSGVKENPFPGTSEMEFMELFNSVRNESSVERAEAIIREICEAPTLNAQNVEVHSFRGFRTVTMGFQKCKVEEDGILERLRDMGEDFLETEYSVEDSNGLIRSPQNENCYQVSHDTNEQKVVAVYHYVNDFHHCLNLPINYERLQAYTAKVHVDLLKIARWMDVGEEINKRFLNYSWLVYVNRETSQVKYVEVVDTIFRESPLIFNLQKTINIYERLKQNLDINFLLVEKGKFVNEKIYEGLVIYPTRISKKLFPKKDEPIKRKRKLSEVTK